MNSAAIVRLTAALALVPLSIARAADSRVQTVLGAGPAVLYRLTVGSAPSHRFHVRILDARPPRGELGFAIPAWAPGYYQILNSQLDIEHIRASTDDGTDLPVSHREERTWTIDTSAAGTHTVILDYDVNAHDAGLGFFGSSLDTASMVGYINGASAFLYEVGHTDRPVRLEASVPAGWKIATALGVAQGDPLVASTPSGHAPSHAFEADSYDSFIDCPIQFGRFSATKFTAGGADYQVVCAGSIDWNRARVAAALQKIANAVSGVFGRPPFKRYVFFFHIGGGGFQGGLEHHNSTVIHINTPLGEGSGEGLLTVAAHEYFHAWNVKRIRPAGLGPFDYAHPVRTASLWWAEGVTDYYADIVLLRSGLRDRTWLLKDIARRMASLDSNPARLHVSLEEASRKAWEGQSEGFGGLSYYLKGSLIGLYFDLKIRAATQGRSTLDDVMRSLDREYGSKNRGYPETALLATIEKVAGADLRAEYDALVRSPGEIAWGPLLDSVGLALETDSASHLGLQLEPGPEGAASALVTGVEPGSAANRCGILPEDRLVAVNGVPTTLDGLRGQLSVLAPKSPLTYVIQRGRDRLIIHGDSGLVIGNYRLLPRRSPRATVDSASLFLPGPGAISQPVADAGARP